jgi:hypothetical protein
MREAKVFAWFLRSLSVVVALLTGEWVAPTIARASCGDYVTMAPHNSDPSEGRVIAFPLPESFELGLSAESHLLAQSFNPNRTPPSRPCRRCPAAPDGSPCQGPWCSDSQVPLTPPITSVPTPHDPFLSGRFAVAVANDARHALDALHHSLCRIHRVTSIYHPPRPI